MNKKLFLKLLIESILESDVDEAKKNAPKSAIRKVMGNAQAAKKLAAAFKSTSVSDFVTQFKKIASDPKVQAILKAGVTDGNPDDEKISYEKGNIAVEVLLPTQKEIGFDQSIKNILTDQFGSLTSILDGNAGSNLNGPIVTYNGKYVIDGHHRWSQAFAANPKTKIDNLDIKGNLKPTQILKLVHAAIAAQMGELPSANPQGINILKGISMDQVQKAVDNNLSEKAQKLYDEKKGLKDKNAVAKYIFENLQLLIRKNKPISGAPGRKDMPQTDADKKPANVKLDKLAAGEINFKNPAEKDVQNEVRSLQERAGLKRRY